MLREDHQRALEREQRLVEEEKKRNDLWVTDLKSGFEAERLSWHEKISQLEGKLKSFSASPTVHASPGGDTSSSTGSASTSGERSTSTTAATTTTTAATLTTSTATAATMGTSTSTSTTGSSDAPPPADPSRTTEPAGARASDSSTVTRDSSAPRTGTVPSSDDSVVGVLAPTSGSAEATSEHTAGQDRMVLQRNIISKITIGIVKQ